MAIVVVGGDARGVGKTSLVCALIAALPEFDWTAVKITSHEHWLVEPIWEESEPGEETDTARYLAAGARRAFLLTVPESHDLNETRLGRVLGEFFRYAGRGRNVIFESNRVLHHVQPDLCLMVQGAAPVEAKPSFEDTSRLADAVISLRPADAPDEPAPPLASGFPNGSGSVFHLAQSSQMTPAMEHWVRERLKAR